MNLVVGIADCQLSKDPEASLITYALGSCLGIAIHDPVARVGGLLHLMLPESSIDRFKAQQKPFMFADTGVPLLFRRAYELGAEKKRLAVWITGGAQVMDDNKVFDIGKRNYLAVRKILWKAGVLVHGEAVGGRHSRNLRLDVGTGTCWLREPGRPEQPMTAAPNPAGGRACS